MTDENPIGDDSALSAAPPSALAALNWQEQDEILRALWGQNLTPQEIAEKLGRSVAAVMTRAARLGLPRRFAPGRKPGRRPAEDKAAAAATTRRVTVQEAFGEAPTANMQVAQRICLMCLKKFTSQGRHNRICGTCKGSSDYEAGSRIPDIHIGTDT